MGNSQKAVLTILLAMSTASPALAQEGPANYQDHLVPLLQNHCLGCHNSEKKKGDLDLSTYTAAMAGGGSGELARPGDSGNSTLWKVVAHLDEPHMPPKKAKLPEAELAVFRKWIDGGLIEAKGGAAKKSSKPKVDLAIGGVAKGKPEGPPPMPKDLLLEPQLRTSRSESITALATSPWAPLAAVSGQHQVFLYNTDTLEFAGLLPFPERRVHVLRFSRNGSLLLAAGGRGAKAGAVIVWDIKTGDRLFEIGGEYDLVLAADISPDHSQIALGGPGKLVKIWSTKDGELQHSIKKHTDWVTALEFSPDGSLLATGDRNGGLHVWEARSGNIHHSLNGHKAAISGVSWRPDSGLLASGSEDGQVILWELAGGTKVKGWQAHPAVESVSYAMDGRLVTCGRDLITRTWTGDGAKQRDFEAFSDVALRAAVSHDGSKVLAGDWTGEVRVWNAADGKRLGVLNVNPPTLAERVEADSKALAEAKAAQLATQAQLQAAQAAADQFTAALKSAAEGHAEADKALAAARQAVDSAKADVTARQAEAAQKAEAAKGAGLAAQKATDELRKLQEANAALLKEVESDPSKAKALEASQKAASDRAADVAQLTETAQKARTAAEAAQGAMGPAQKALAEKQASLKSLTDKKQAESGTPGEVQKAADAAVAQVAKSQKALEASSAPIAALEARLAHWKAAQFNLKVHAKKAEAAAVQAEYEGLLAQVEADRKAEEKAKADSAAALKSISTHQETILKRAAALKEVQERPAKAEAAREPARKALADVERRPAPTQPLATLIADLAKADRRNLPLAYAQSQMDRMTRELTEAKAALAAREAEVEKARSTVAAAEKALAEAKIAQAQAGMRVLEFDRASVAAHGRIAPDQARADAFKPKVEAAKAEVEQLRAEYAKLLSQK